MKVWWCEEHGYQATEYAVNHPVETLRRCWGTAYGESDGPWDSEEDFTPCRMVLVRLVPADAPANEIEQKARHLKQILATPRHPNASDIDLLEAMGDLLVALAAGSGWGVGMKEG